MYLMSFVEYFKFKYVEQICELCKIFLNVKDLVLIFYTIMFEKYYTKYYKILYKNIKNS